MNTLVLIQDIVKESGLRSKPELLFKPDGSLSPLGFSTIMGQSSIVFKNALFASDVSQKYTVEGLPKKIKDPAAVKEAHSKYKDIDQMVKDEISKFRNENQDMFDTVPSMPNIAPYCSVELNESYNNKVMDPDVANFLFRTISEELKEYKIENAGSLNIATRKVIKPEFSDQYEAYRKEVIQKHGLPSNQEIEEGVPLIEVIPRSLRRGKIDNGVAGSEKEAVAEKELEVFINSLVLNFEGK